MRTSTGTSGFSPKTQCCGHQRSDFTFHTNTDSGRRLVTVAFPKCWVWPPLQWLEGGAGGVGECRRCALEKQDMCVEGVLAALCELLGVDRDTRSCQGEIWPLGMVQISRRYCSFSAVVQPCSGCPHLAGWGLQDAPTPEVSCGLSRRPVATIWKVRGSLPDRKLQTSEMGSNSWGL